MKLIAFQDILVDVLTTASSMHNNTRFASKLNFSQTKSFLQFRFKTSFNFVWFKNLGNCATSLKCLPSLGKNGIYHLLINQTWSLLPLFFMFFHHWCNFVETNWIILFHMYVLQVKIFYLQSSSKVLGRLPFLPLLFLPPPAPGPMLIKTLMFVRVIVLLYPNIE